MPRYEYECTKCGPFEVTQRISDPPLTQHECGEPASRSISKVAFALKGGGWYADGYNSTSKASSEACSPAGCAKPGCAAKASAS